MASTESYTQAVDSRYVSRVSIEDSFKTNREVLDYALSDADNKTGLLEALPSYSLTAKRRDTRVGGNDAINSYYQFNENDDLIHPINKTNTDETSGMGRVYNETFDEQQQLIYLSFGVPDYTNAATFVDKAYNVDLAKLMNTGDVSYASKIGQFLGKTLGTVVLLPLYPIKFAFEGLEKILSDTNPTKYYDFKPTMALYYKAVNVILAHLAVNMNLTAMEDDTGDIATAGIPDILKTHGLDILTILSRKNWYDKLETGDASATSPTTDEILKELATNPLYESSMWERGVTGAALGFTEALRYVGFRIEKSAESSESASNTTKEPEILSAINSAVSSGQSSTFTMKSLAETAPGKVAQVAYDGIMGIISGAASSMSLTGGVEMLKGSGFVDIPEVWASSNFTKSYNFDFQLRTPYGDPLSIFYSLYIPLAMIMAGSFPRSVGENAYTAPFLVRAYCQGMFAIPLGIIDSITIKRGAAEYGWADNMLPTQIDVSFSIKDLSPIMHIAIADGGISDWTNILGQNSSFQEYLLTLSGTNIAQRTLIKELLKKRAKALLTILSNNKLNPMMFGFSLSNTRLGRMITKFTPVSKLPGIEN